MNYASPLARKQMEIANFKREMKRQYGPKSCWPVSVRARYDAMKQEARERTDAGEEIAA